ncbi:uncharacterized protein B0T23DRAFT_394379 [Neurospora hispaniola]|uniref:Uncharacterized protein n=1 Tax=Neurospora hispaniola TaxID=588809 RepID=A0AAJ0MSE1_9PEZI|nr:hypothetical protein B0T23DRAFT_394379 [Neurospora hispaniola]
MGIQVVESSLEPPRSSFAQPQQQQQQQYGPWHYRDVRSSSRRYGWGEGPAAAAAAAAALISNAFSEKKRFAGAAEGGSSRGNGKGTSKMAAACLPLPALVVEQAQEKQPGTSSAISTEVLPVQAPEPAPAPATAITSASAPATAITSASAPATATTSPWPSFTILIPSASTSPILTFPLTPSNPPHLSQPEAHVLARPKSLKRSRPCTDVDGHNTAPLPCKKRRLRLNLVTSRLSHPFSLPATHILNRESILKGDKRLRSIAAAANRRMAMAGWGFGGVGGQNGGGGGMAMAMGGNGSAASLLRKMAVMNRFRMRMMGEGLMRAQQAQRAAQAQAVQAQAHEVGQGRGGGGGPPAVAGHVGVGGTTGGVPMQRTAQGHDGYGPGTSHQPPPPRGSQAGGQQVPVPVITGFPPPVIHTTTSNSEPSTPQGLSPSPPLHPLHSPDLRPTDDQDDQDFDDEDVAFPTSAHESRYEGGDEEEGHEVYADFGVLFGGGGGDDDLDVEGDRMSGEMSVEQQECLGLDNWDGISWGAA